MANAPIFLSTFEVGLQQKLDIDTRAALGLGRDTKHHIGSSCNTNTPLDWLRQKP